MWNVMFANTKFFFSQFTCAICCYLLLPWAYWIILQEAAASDYVLTCTVALVVVNKLAFFSLPLPTPNKESCFLQCCCTCYSVSWHAQFLHHKVEACNKNTGNFSSKSQHKEVYFVRRDRVLCKTICAFPLHHTSAAKFFLTPKMVKLPHWNAQSKLNIILENAYPVLKAIIVYISR